MGRGRAARCRTPDHDCDRPGRTTPGEGEADRRLFAERGNGSPGLDHLAAGNPGRHGGLLGARRRGCHLHGDAAARDRAGGNPGGLGQALGAGQVAGRRLRQQGRGYHARRFADRGVPHRPGSITSDLGDEHLRGEFGAQPDESRSGQGLGCDHRPGTGVARGSQGHRRRRDQPGREGLRHLRPGAFGDRRE